MEQMEQVHLRCNLLRFVVKTGSSLLAYDIFVKWHASEGQVGDNLFVSHKCFLLTIL